jgi:6-phosphogluconolactonase (cycloisomerase 2 family)
VIGQRKRDGIHIRTAARLPADPDMRTHAVLRAYLPLTIALRLCMARLIGTLLIAALLATAPARASTFEPIQWLRDGQAGVDGLNNALDVAVSPDGTNVYVAAFTDNAIAVFRRNTVTGQLTFSEAAFKGALRGVSAIRVSPDGLHVYATTYAGNFLAVFDRDPATGALSVKELVQQTSAGVDGLYRPIRMAMSPGGKWLYVVSETSNTVAVFERDPVDGTLAWRFIAKDGSGGMSSLDGAFSAAVSPSGEHLYVAAYDDNAVTVFSQDAVSGTLNPAQVVSGNDHGFSGARSLAISPDGEQAYVIAYLDSSISVFNRNKSNGTLEFLERHVNTIGGIEGMERPESITISPDGLLVLIASGGNDNAIALFSRDPDTGSLTFVESIKDDLDAPYIHDPKAIASSADGRYFYVASFGDHALTVLAGVDLDHDGIPDLIDNCPADSNSDQANTDADALGDACDDDDDGDGVPDAADDFPLDPHRYRDADGDGIDDAVDNCPLAANVDQVDSDSDSAGDACDEDDDGDGVVDTADAYPKDPSRSGDFDGDGIDNADDSDDDNDGVSDMDELAAGRNPLFDERRLVITIIQQLL